MKKSEIKRAIIVAISVILVVIAIKCFQNRDTTVKDLQKKGYTDSEITTLLNNFDKEQIKNLIANEYNKYLPKLLENKYYIPNNLQKYLEYCKTNENIDDVISIINTGVNQSWYTNTKEVTNLDNSMLVNKFNYLPANYMPDDIVNILNWYAYEGHSIKKEVYNQFVKMFNAAKEENLKIIVNSSYRTFEQQENIYKNSSDDYASRPGFSEHQTGLALDIVKDGVIANEFENTDEFRWLQKNAHKYGFILRYPKGKEHITGYSYESWHYRYLGIELATKVYESNLTYEEYYAYYCEYKGQC